MDTVILQELRFDIDALYQLTRPLKPIEAGEYQWPVLYPQPTKELDEVCKSLLLAKAWCGKLMGELGGTSPYKNDGNRKSVGDIEPTDSQAEHLENVIGHFLANRKNSWSDKNHVEKIDKLRELVDYVSDKFIKNYSTCESILITIIFMHIQEAKLWLGFELGRVRDEAQIQIDAEVKRMEVKEQEINNVVVEVQTPIPFNLFVPHKKEEGMNNDELRDALNE